MCHLVDTAVVNAYLAEVHGDVNALEELVGGVDGLLGNLLLGQRGVDAEDVDAVLHEAVQRLFIQDMAHPARRDDGQTLAVGDVVVGREGVLNGVAGPATVAVAKRQDAVAAVGAAEHHLGAGGVVLRIGQTLAGILHQASQHRLAEAVVQQRRISHEVLLHGVVHGIGTAGSGLLLRHGEGIDGVENRSNGEQ